MKTTLIVVNELLINNKWIRKCVYPQVEKFCKFIVWRFTQLAFFKYK